MIQDKERRKINADWIKALRNDLGLSQEAFADRLGVSRSAVARWELGNFRPTKLAANALMHLAVAGKEAKS